MCGHSWEPPFQLRYSLFWATRDWDVLLLREDWQLSPCHQDTKDWKVEKMESSESRCVCVEPVLFGGDRPENWGNIKDVFSITGEGNFIGLPHNVRDLSHESHRVYSCQISFGLIIKLCLVIFKLYIFFKIWKEYAYRIKKNWNTAEGILSPSNHLHLQPYPKANWLTISIFMSSGDYPVTVDNMLTHCFHHLCYWSILEAERLLTLPSIPPLPSKVWQSQYYFSFFCWLLS